MRPASLTYHDVNVPAAEAESAGSHVLAFPMQQQQANEWCWAACAVSAADFYVPLPQPRAQCALVNAVLAETDPDLPDACAPIVPEACNVSADLRPAFERVGVGSSTQPGWTVFADVTNLIDAGLPPAVLIAWNLTKEHPFKSGHFVFLTGYGRSADGQRDMLHVSDSLNGSTQLPFDQFPEHYMTGGNWNNTFATKPDPPPPAAASATEGDDR